MAATPSGSLTELVRLFLRLGATAFGGPAAHIAMMRDEVVDRRRWMTDAEFVDLIAATNLIPGPNSTEMAIHLGYRRAGIPGLLVAGSCFILPACLLVMTIAWAYRRYGDTPEVGWIMYGVGPVIIVIVAQALWKLGQAALTGVAPPLIGAAVAAGSLWGVDELVLLAAGGVAGLLVRRITSGAVVGLLVATVGSATTLLAAGAATVVPFSVARLGAFFLKVGSVLFGSGYVLLAFLRADLVDHWGWLTEQELIDAITVGQVTPGPVFTTATFIGYLLGGWIGGIVATVAIFAPGFVFVAITHPLIPRLRRSPIMAGLLDGVVAASLGLMAAVTWHLAQATVIDVSTALIAVACGGALWRWHPNSTWLIAAGATTGWLVGGG